MKFIFFNFKINFFPTDKTENNGAKRMIRDCITIEGSAEKYCNSQKMKTENLLDCRACSKDLCNGNDTLERFDSPSRKDEFELVDKSVKEVKRETTTEAAIRKNDKSFAAEIKIQISMIFALLIINLIL